MGCHEQMGASRQGGKTGTQVGRAEGQASRVERLLCADGGQAGRHEGRGPEGKKGMTGAICACRPDHGGGGMMMMGQSQGP